MLSLLFCPDTTELRRVRAEIRAWAIEQDVAEWPLTLIATELAANAITAAAGGQPVEVTIEVAGGQVAVAVIDCGRGFGGPGRSRTAGRSLPSPSQPRGRGLFLVRQLATDLRIERRSGRTVVSARLPAEGSNPTGRFAP